MDPDAIAFRWHAPDGEMLLPLSPLLFRALGARVEPDDPRVDVLRRALFEADPLADEVVAWMQRLPPGEGRALLERALDRKVHAAPSPLDALLAEADHVPAWLDRREVRRGTRTLLRVGRGGAYALGAASLMSGYLSNGAVKPLVATGALTRMTRRRLAETGKYIRDLAVSGELGRDSEGFKASVRVRVLHAQVRASQRDWNTAAWGVPINQRDMLGTHLEFTVAFIAGLTALGYLLTAGEREGLMHMWRYAGLLVGVREDLLPASFREGVELAWIFNATEKGPDDDGRALAAALVETWESGASYTGTLGRLEGRFLVGLARLLLGKTAADALRLPDDAWKYAPLVVAPAHGAAEALRMLVPGGRARAVRRGREAIEADLRRILGGHARPAPTGHGL